MYMRLISTKYFHSFLITLHSLMECYSDFCQVAHIRYRWPIVMDGGMTTFSQRHATMLHEKLVHFGLCN